MLIAAFICVFSVAAGIKFAVLSWRAGIVRVAESPITDAALEGSQLPDFKGISAYHSLCPDLSKGTGMNLRAISLYYKTLQFLKAFSWAQGEMALCTRYAAVALSQRSQLNRALMADVHSF
jgi:hypothetical protein